MFSIVTPTYNRADTLPRVYNSLVKQTLQEFHWVIVDDCSTDTTHLLVSEWIKTANFKIEYHKLDQNRGKSHAVNYGLQFCKEPYTIIVDSDDSFVPNTIFDLKNLWADISETDNNIAAIWTLVTNEEGNIKGEKFPEDKWSVNFKQRVLDLKKPLTGDKWHSWKTDILKAYPMYDQRSCHVQESHTWNAINKDYDFLCVNINHLTAHITEGSLITSKKSKKDTSKVYYYGSYYGLKEVSIKEMISHKYYRYLAFDYIKSKFYFSDKSFKLGLYKTLASYIIFLLMLPKRLLKL